MRLDTMVVLTIVSVVAVLLIIVGCEKAANAPSIKIVEDGSVDALDAVDAGDAKVFEIMVDRNRFYPSVIEVNKGDSVLLRLTSPQEESGFEMKGYKINTRVPKDLEVKVKFLADKAGSFVFTCGNYCNEIKEEVLANESENDAEVLGVTVLEGKLVVR